MIEFYRTFTLSPDFTSPPVSSYREERRDIQLANAKRYGLWDGRGVRNLSATWVANNILDVRTLRDFLIQNSGRANPFYIPSWSQDFRVVSLSPANSSSVVVTVGGDYIAELDPSKLDKFGTIAWFYNRDRQIHVTRILSAQDVQNGTVLLTMELPTPFDLNVGIFCGFCIFAKQVQDEANIVYLSPDACTMQLQVEEAIHTLPTNATKPIEGGGDINSYPPLIEVRQTPIPPGIGLTFKKAELLGPEAYAQTQTFPHQLEWSFEIIDNVGVELQAEGEAPFLSDYYLTAPEGGHISGCFDLGGREQIAVGLTSGEIEIRYFGGGPAVFEGFSPQMINTWAVDATLTPGTSDVVVVYLKQGESKLFCRFLNGGYSTEYVLANSPVNPLYLIGIEASGGELLIQGIDVTHNYATWVAQVDPVIPIWTEKMSGILGVDGGALTKSLFLATGEEQDFVFTGNIEANGGAGGGEYRRSLFYTTGDERPAFDITGSVASVNGQYQNAGWEYTTITGGDVSAALEFEPGGEYFFAKPIVPDQTEAGTFTANSQVENGTYEIE